ncbi:unnamed protein product [Gongylonema pulchrum]|uniref:Uncharacterized protein n=1 Tax=Gongylonema pulchrum TaxID=637853 RepID=A0A183DZP9_9BILA|nr:unnamed protein product [Gongylonema pulchrum]
MASLHWPFVDHHMTAYFFNPFYYEAWRSTLMPKFCPPSISRPLLASNGPLLGPLAVGTGACPAIASRPARCATPGNNSTNMAQNCISEPLADTAPLHSPS